MTPGIHLALAFAILAVLAALLFPQRGLLWRWRRAREVAERVRLEHALKHLYECEYARQPAALAGLAKALAMGRDRAARLVERLKALGLVERDPERLGLTPEGRSYALRVIRVHRLWERHLAERTGLSAWEWHEQADRMEHTMTAAEADALAAELGHPLFDPHGDPIPTSDGAMPERRGVPLTELEPGTSAMIIHVEDEPRAVYAQLVAARLFPGVMVRVLERTDERLRVEAELQEHVLAPVVAANLTVEPLVELPEPRPADGRLSSLAIGQEDVVLGISPACHGIERRRLLDLGIVPGTVIRAELESMGGDPVAYRIRGAMIALRRDQADWIYVRTGAS